MDVPSRNKLKGKKSKADKQKNPKKGKCEGPTCSSFLSELTRKLISKKKQQEANKNIVQSIINSITNLLPIKFSRRASEEKEPTLQIESLQTYAPELIRNDTIEVPRPVRSNPIVNGLNLENTINEAVFKVPMMPVANSEVFKTSNVRMNKTETEDAAINTGSERDIANEIAKHVATLRKISLIAEEFNQKTAKNLKEIVDSVQEDLIKKLEEVKAEQRASSSKSEKQPYTKKENKQ